MPIAPKKPFQGFEDEAEEEIWDGSPDPPVSDVLDVLRRYSVAYANITATDLPKLLRSDDMDSAIDIMAEVRAYFQGTSLVTS